MATECNVIGWLYPALARVVSIACDNHDVAYKYRLGTRWSADWLWLREALLLVIASRKLWMIPAVLVCYAGLVVGSWYLWYDLDERLKDAASWVRWKYHRVRNAIDKVF